MPLQKANGQAQRTPTRKYKQKRRRAKAKKLRGDSANLAQEDGTPAVKVDLPPKLLGESDPPEDPDILSAAESDGDVFSCKIGAHREDYWTQCSKDLSRFLRYTAHRDKLLDSEDWIPLETALSYLPYTAAVVAKAVRLSERVSADGRQTEGRFELWMSGSQMWIRATNSEYYRQRSRGQKRTRAKAAAVVAKAVRLSEHV